MVLTYPLVAGLRKYFYYKYLFVIHLAVTLSMWLACVLLAFSSVQTKTPVYNHFIFIMFLLGVVYFNSTIAIPRFLSQRRYSAFALSFAGCLLLYLLLSYVLIACKFTSVQNHSSFATFSHLLFGGGIGLFGFLGLFFGSAAVSSFVYQHRVRFHNMKAELNLIKSQMNPHFLFNTFNNIYSLSLNNSERAPRALVKLSGMMRYSVDDAGSMNVPLVKELDYISNYIYLQELRHSGIMKIHYEIAGNAADKQIAPMLLSPFVEHAFDYGVNVHNNTAIHIYVHVQQSSLFMIVSYAKKASLSRDKYPTYDRIATTKKRLDMLYSGKYSMEVEDNFKSHTVNLKIEFT